jgi:hypothetical protein
VEYWNSVFGCCREVSVADSWQFERSTLFEGLRIVGLKDSGGSGGGYG